MVLSSETYQRRRPLPGCFPREALFFSQLGLKMCTVGLMAYLVKALFFMKQVIVHWVKILKVHLHSDHELLFRVKGGHDLGIYLWRFAMHLLLKKVVTWLDRYWIAPIRLKAPVSFTGPVLRPRTRRIPPLLQYALVQWSRCGYLKWFWGSLSTRK